MLRRPLRGRLRARPLALPFVVTAATVACSTLAKHPTNPPPPEEETLTAEDRIADAGVAEPRTNASDAMFDGMNGETISKNPPPPRALPPLPPSEGTISLQRDGSCLWVETVPPLHCPTGMSCNPPPPKMVTVPCPADLEKKK